MAINGTAPATLQRCEGLGTFVGGRPTRKPSRKTSRVNADTAEPATTPPLAALMDYVSGSRGDYAIERLRIAADETTPLIDDGRLDRISVIFVLTLAAEIAGVARRDAEALLASKLPSRSAR